MSMISKLVTLLSLTLSSGLAFAQSEYILLKELFDKDILGDRVISVLLDEEIIEHHAGDYIIKKPESLFDVLEQEGVLYESFSRLAAICDDRSAD